MKSTIEILADAQLELKQMHNHYQPNCNEDCPTRLIIYSCTVAIGNMRTVIERLEAWRDNASLMLKQALPEDEKKWINQKQNYEALLTLLGVTN